MQAQCDKLGELKARVTLSAEHLQYLGAYLCSGVPSKLALHCRIYDAPPSRQRQTVMFTDARPHRSWSQARV
jgi:hypothetical protein